ncbi:phytoene desaturase family protein [Chloroflexota bacterium]
MEKTIIIIGAGIAGLSAGCYAQMNGYKSAIFEMHDKPGGLCTAWKRGGYTFDGCIHSVGGLNPKFKLYHYWNELIDMKKLKFFYHDILGNIEDENGRIATIFTDPDKLREELISIAPEDAKFIDSFIKAVKKLANFDLMPSKPLELWNPLDYYVSQFRVAPVLHHLMKWRKSLEDITKKCNNPLLKRVLNEDFFSHFPAYFLIFSLGHLHNRNVGYPIGGSLPFARLLENRYLGLGGRVFYHSKVTKINVKNNRAIGITLENGETHNDVDIVVSASDGHYTIFKMLEGNYINEKIKKLYDEHPRWPSMVLVSLGVSRTFENEPTSIGLHTEKAFVVDNKSKLYQIPITIYNFDPTLAPEGRTCIRVILRTDNYEYWYDLRKNNMKKYNQEKDRVGKEIIEILDRRLGNIKNNVDVIDVVTPATLRRYTNNWKGSIQGWEWTPRLIPEFIKKELPGLRNFYLIGQWVEPGGGVPTAFMSGRNLLQIICKRDKKKFLTTLQEMTPAQGR